MRIPLLRSLSCLAFTAVFACATCVPRPFPRAVDAGADASFAEVGARDVPVSSDAIDSRVIDVELTDTSSTVDNAEVAAVTDSMSDVGGPDVGGSDVGGSDVGGPDVGGSDVGGRDVGDAVDAGPLPMASDRILTVRNACPDTTVTVGTTGEFVGECGTDGSCPAGSACLPSRTPPGCFWVLPDPEVGSRMLRSGESATYVLRTPALNHVRWSGEIYGRTGCATIANCETGRCPGGECGSGVSPIGPTTKAVLTLVDNRDDSYGVSIVDGVNLPMSIGADTAGTYRLSPTGTAGDYWCGNSGAQMPSSAALTGCSWNFDPTMVDGSNRSTTLRFVVPTARSCTDAAGCMAPEVCGTAILDAPTRPSLRCGRQIGWATPHQLCRDAAGAYVDVLRCAESAPGGVGSRSDLFSCTGAYAPSCRVSGASSTCCGCAVWPQAPSIAACVSENPGWTTVARPWAAFLKNACPTARSYADDEGSSTFRCRTESSPNGTDYVVTFCPGGVRGF